jgi:hypothetical protein
MLSFRNRACKKTLPAGLPATTGLQPVLRKKVIVRSSPENSPISARAHTDFNSRSRRKSRARPRYRSRPSLVSRITATKFIPRLTARWNALSSTRWRAMQLRRLIYLRLRRYIRHRSEPDWHFQEKPIHLGVQVERVVLNALGDDCGSAALYLRPLRSICHRLRRSRSTHGAHLERSPRRDDPPKNKELASCLASSRLLLLIF